MSTKETTNGFTGLFDAEGNSVEVRLPEGHSFVFGEPVTGGIKHDSGKIPMELLDRVPLEAIAEVFGFGAAKYGRYNYKNGLAWSRLIGAAQRHLTAFNSGEDLDPESGKSHLAHLGCCVFMLLEQLKTHPELDDRYKQNPQRDEK